MIVYGTLSQFLFSLILYVMPLQRAFSFKLIEQQISINKNKNGIALIDNVEWFDNDYLIARFWSEILKRSLAEGLGNQDFFFSFKTFY